MRDCTIRIAKTKALISFAVAVTAKLICVFVFAYAKSRFSYDQAHFISIFLQFEELKRHKTYSECEELVTDILNSDSRCDIELMEAIKLLMLLKARDLHGDMSQGNDVPIFVWLMFARDTSENVELFVKNHLNPVGDSGGLEQVRHEIRSVFV